MVTIILDFISQNWNAFVVHCASHGITSVNEIEKELEKLEHDKGEG